MTTRDHREIAITGCGWVTPVAAGSITDILSAASAEAVSPAPRGVYRAVPEGHLAPCADLSTEIKRDHGAWMTAAALTHACRTAGIELSAFSGDRVGLVLGCGLAGQLGMIAFANEVREQSPRFVSPIHFPQTVGNYIAGALARGCDIRGPNLTLASGIASSLDALTEGCRILTSRRADVVLAGGVEVLLDSLAQGLRETGTTLSEGSCLFVLERRPDAEQRGAEVLALLARDGPDATTGSAPSTTGTRPSLVSTAGFREVGAVYVEHAIGRCVGAAGAAAVAAAIGAARGAVVPVVKDGGLTELQELCVPSTGDSDGHVTALVEAREGESSQRALAFSILLH